MDTLHCLRGHRRTFLKPEEDPKQILQNDFQTTMDIHDCLSLPNLISDGLTGLEIIHSENSKEDNQLKLTNLHNGYDNPELSFSQESTRSCRSESFD